MRFGLDLTEFDEAHSPMLSPAGSVLDQGFAVVPDLIDGPTATHLAEAVDRATEAAGTLRRDDAVYGMRDLLRSVPEVRALAGSAVILDQVEAILGPGAFAVRGLWFDKTPEANWGVPWHQDLTIAVAEQVDTPGFGPWTVKAGINHVRPPVAVLEAMVTVRVHLDDCGAGRGPLRVVPGSHREGRLDVAATRGWLDRDSAVDCLVGRGGAVLMRPLLLHSSRAALEPDRRRVIHLEYAAGPLPGGLPWFEVVGRTAP